VIRVYAESGNVIETHEHAGDFQRVVAAANWASIVLTNDLNFSGESAARWKERGHSADLIIWNVENNAPDIILNGRFQKPV
jgi:hypothetical protein